MCGFLRWSPAYLRRCIACSKLFALASDMFHYLPPTIESLGDLKYVLSLIHTHALALPYWTLIVIDLHTFVGWRAHTGIR